MASGTPLTHAFLYLKNAKIRIKYPNFAGFALESASPRAPNMCVTPTKMFLNVKQACLYTQQNIRPMGPQNPFLIKKNFSHPHNARFWNSTL